MKLSLALSLSTDIQNDLALLRGSLDDVQWLSAEQSFIPLQNLGTITARHKLEELDFTLSHLHWAPFPLALTQVAHRQDARQDRLTLGLTPHEKVAALQKQLRTQLRQAGFPPPRKNTVAELTIALMEPSEPISLMPWIQRHNLFHSRNMLVDHICLMETLTSAGEQYHRTLESYPATTSIMTPAADLFIDQEDGGFSHF